MQKIIIIAAITARAYAQAAVASGYAVITLDAFADADLKCITYEAYKINMQNGQVDVEDFKRQFKNINLADVDGFCYGSMFDAAPMLLEWIAAQVTIFGNSAEILKTAKAFSFFKFLDNLQIQHPKVSQSFSDVSEGWLSKAIGGSGGMHVRLATNDVSGDYYQREIVGEPVSMLFLANGKEMQVIGFNRQLTAPSPELPYRYSGAVGGLKLLDSVERAFCDAAAHITKALGLRGINSLDAVLCDEALYILELNPRLSASVELYPSIWGAHLQACNGKLDALPKFDASRAKMTIYAEKNIEIEHDFFWPNWTADLPSKELACNKFFLEKDAPICTILAQAETVELAHVQLLERVKQLEGIMR